MEKKGGGSGKLASGSQDMDMDMDMDPPRGQTCLGESQNLMTSTGRLAMPAPVPGSSKLIPAPVFCQVGVSPPNTWHRRHRNIHRA